ncbi:hypothetical protein [Sutcliffiella halmapala]|uniref:hypothetical protein n=1 Tax=Sutcliffiella halmapala TaxID=79882 RepID=UPI001116FCED|nr:hypothetical protein [Sutcliffiella halmapala]
MNKKRWLSIILTTIITALVLFMLIHIFSPKNIISETENIHIYWVENNGIEVSVDEKKLINILSKYKSKRTFKSYFPYHTDKIHTQISLDHNQSSHKFILLGEFNIWYEPGGPESKRRTYKILNAQELKEELNSLLEEEH